MKKSAVEKLEPLPAEKAKGGRRFVAAATVEEFRGEEHLIVDIYRNLRKELKTPLVRICLTDRDFGNYYHTGGRWTRNKIENVEVGDEYFIGEQTVSIKQEDEKLVLSFAMGYRNDTWFDRIRNHQETINHDRYRRKNDTRESLLEERIRQMPEIPEEFYHWCEQELMAPCRYIFYKRKGRFAEFHCGCCGKSYRYPTKRPGTFEGQYEHTVDTPKAGTWGRCEKCDERAVFRQLGRADEITDKKTCYMIQPYGDSGGAVVRCFDIYKTSRAGHKPLFEDVEVNRSFFIPGKKKIQKDYQVYSSLTGTQLWLPNNIPGMATITVKAGKLYEGNLSELEGTELEHSGIQEYAQDYSCFMVESYMESYRRLPALEMIVKMKLTDLARRLVDNDYSTWNSLNGQGKSAAEVVSFRINQG